jgi:hypothetical protein
LETTPVPKGSCQTQAEMTLLRRYTRPWKSSTSISCPELFWRTEHFCSDWFRPMRLAYVSLARRAM